MDFFSMITDLVQQCVNVAFSFFGGFGGLGAAGQADASTSVSVEA